MTRFQDFLTTPIGSMLRVTLGLTLGYLVLALQQGTLITEVSIQDLNTWVSAALAVSLPIGIAALNPRDTRFGRK